MGLQHQGEATGGLRHLGTAESKSRHHSQRNLKLKPPLTGRRFRPDDTAR